MDSNLPPVYNPAPEPVPPPVLKASPPPPQRERKGRGWMILSFFLAAALLLVFGIKFIHFAGSIFTPSHAVAMAESHGLQEVVIENKNSNNKIAVIEVDGVISSSPVDRSGMDMVRSIKK